MAGDRSNELDETVAASAAGDATLPADDPALDATVLPPSATRADEARLPTVDAKRYRIRGEVGRGGLGRVLSADDLLLHRTVALKELLEDAGGARARFEREIFITARLQHPSIVPLYDAGRWPHRAPFYAMKLIAGQPLSDVIAKSTALEERLALLPNVLAVADAMAYAHRERIIHRDLKPHNVLVGAYGETVVIDWGIAKDLAKPDEDSSGSLGSESAIRASGLTGGSGTVAGSLLGTPGYMAPEQAVGLAVDERSDVYAIGAILYHLVSGVGPHEGDTIQEMLDRAARGDVTPLPEREPRVPAELWGIVAKAMARDPADRYPTAAELADDLRRYTTDQLVGAHRYTLAHRIRRFIRRNAAASVALLLVALFALWSRWTLHRERQDAFEAARLALELSAVGIRRDVAASLDQADPILTSLRALTDPALPLAQVGPRMVDLVVGRPGVANASIGFPSGLFRGTFVPQGEHDVAVQESVVEPDGTKRRDYRLAGGGLAASSARDTDYDVRKRPHYALAERAHARAWTPAHTYFTSRATGITCTEPIYGQDGALRAVTTVDFDVAALSALVAHPPLEGTRSVVFTGDGAVLAFPSATLPDVAIKEGRLLRHEDFADPALEAVFAELAVRRPADLRFFQLHAAGDDYLAAIAPVGGVRAGVEAPLDWYVATVVPSSLLLAPALGRARRTQIALAAALGAAAVIAIAGLLRSRAARPKPR